MSKKYKWGGESVVKNRKGKDVSELWGDFSTEIKMDAKQKKLVEGIVPFEHEDTPEKSADRLRELREQEIKVINPENFVAFDDHLSL